MSTIPATLISTEDHHEPGRYEIRIKGHLDNRWTDWFEGLTITLKDNSETLLTGPVVDQAALHGFLRKVRDLGMPLVAVLRIDPEKTADNNMNTSKHKAITGDEDMNTNRQTATINRSTRKLAFAAGVLYLLTFVSIPTLALYGPVHDANYILGAGPDTPVIIGGILEIIVALAGIGTAFVLFPVLKKQHEVLALALVASRILEASTIFIGVAFILTIVTLRQTGAGADALITSHTLATLYDRIFLLGQSFMPAINDLLLGFLLYQSRLVPRVLSSIGMIGGVVLAAGYLAVMFGLIGQHAPMAGLSALLVALFEFSLGGWLVVKGFNPSASTSKPAKTETNELLNVA